MKKPIFIGTPHQNQKGINFPFFGTTNCRNIQTICRAVNCLNFLPICRRSAIFRIFRQFRKQKSGSVSHFLLFCFCFCFFFFRITFFCFFFFHFFKFCFFLFLSFNSCFFSFFEFLQRIY